MVAKVGHVVGVAPNQFLMVLPDEYEGLGAVTGVNKLTGDPPVGADKINLQAAINGGKVFHVRISYKVGTKRKTAKLIVDQAHIGTALGGLTGKTFRGQTILGAVIPSHVTFG
ncbi:hypothetical protein [Nostoc sp.]|uniref:hypothetical protein n=1 Tax=Nostoc sp. TaxID=1180 RepID=UPI002FF9EA84